MLRYKTHRKILDSEIEKSRVFYDKIIKDLQERLKKAENLESVLSKFSSIFGDGDLKFSYSMGTINLGDDVLVYVDDLFGGKVIKQEGIPAIKIETNGVVRTGITKQKADKGYSYKLVRA